MAIHDFPFNIRQVIDNLNIGRVGKNDRIKYCPFCERRDSFQIFDVSDTFKCYACGETGGMLHLHMKLTSCTSLSEARKEIMKDLFGQYEGEEKRRKVYEQAKINREKPESEVFRRNTEECHEVYQALIYELPLSDKHYKSLRLRGLSRSTIALNQYRSYPTSFLKNIADKIMAQGLRLDGVPGFYKDHEGWKLKQLKSGIFIPSRNYRNEIQGYQVRKDQISKWKKTDKGGNVIYKDGEVVWEYENRYITGSTRKESNGTGAIAGIHVASDFDIYFDGKYPILPTNYIFFTEGALKADITHEMTGIPTLAVNGVNAIGQLKPVMNYLSRRGIKYIFLAYDMDSEVNENVSKALLKAYKLMVSLGFIVKRPKWKDSFKGIDDYYVEKYRNGFMR